MRRIKLNRPPPVSGETVTDVASDTKVVGSGYVDSASVLHESQAVPVRTLDISTVSGGYSSNVRVIKRRDSSAVEKDSRRVVVRDEDTEHHTAAPDNVAEHPPNVLVASSSRAKKSRKKRQHGSVAETDNVQLSVLGNDDALSRCATEHTNTASAERRHRTSKKHKRKVSRKDSSDSAQFIPFGSVDEALPDRSGDATLYDNSPLEHPPQRRFTQAERHQTDVRVSKVPSGQMKLDEMLKGFLVKKLAVIENERKDEYPIPSIYTRAAVQNDLEYHSTSKSTRSKYGGESVQQQRGFDTLPADFAHRDSHIGFLPRDAEYTEVRGDRYNPLPYVDYRQHASIHHAYRRLPPNLLPEQQFDDEAGCSKRAHKRHKHSPRHSAHLKKHLSHSEKNKNVIHHSEHSHQMFDFTRPDGSRLNEQEDFDCLEQIRQFVSHNVPRFSQSVHHDYVPVETHCDGNTLVGHGRDLQKSGSSISRHHHKKQTSSKRTLPDNLDKHKRLKRRIGKKNLALHGKKNVKGVVASKKHMKHKHRHHHKRKMLQDVNVDDENAAEKKELLLHDAEAKDEDDDAFNKSRSLSPLGLHRKHRKKQKRQKSAEKTVSRVNEQNVSSMPEKIDIQCEKISSDEEFVPMKLARNEDNAEAAVSNALHKVDVKCTSEASTKSTGPRNKFLKVTGKRPKRKACDYTASSAAKGMTTTEHVHSSDVLAEERPPDLTAEIHVESVADIDIVTNKEISLPSVMTGHAESEILASSSSAPAVSEPVGSCTDAGDDKVMQTGMGDMDQGSNELVADGQTCSVDEAKTQKSIAAGSDNLTKTCTGDESPFGEREHHEIVEKAAVEVSLQEDGQMFSSDNTSDTVGAENLKSCLQEHALAAGDQKCENSKSRLAETNAADTEPKNERGINTSGVEVTDAEVMKSEEVTQKGSKMVFAVAEDGITTATAVNHPLDHTAVAEVLSTPSVTPGSVVKTVTSDVVEDSVSCTTDQKVGENDATPAGAVMGPPLELPPFIAFKKPLPVMRMRLRITDTSADIISSGAKTDDKKPEDGENREEGNQSIYCLGNLP